MYGKVGRKAGFFLEVKPIGDRRKIVERKVAEKRRM